jgi:2-oxoglutarate dehydrogenase E2 component (dihydrolipoamide succinyltransferase)
MPVEVKIPQLGESITEAEIVRWLKADGDQVAEDDPLAEIETDKATAELPSPAAGILEIVVAEGSTVKPGDVVARIQEGKGKGAQKPPATPAQNTPASAARESAREAAAPPSPPPAARPAPPSAAPQAAARPAPAAARSDAAAPRGTATGEATGRAGAQPGGTAETRPAASRADAGNGGADGQGIADRLSPAVRRLVEENRLDPELINASGPDGRLTKEDVLAYLHAAKEASEQRPRDEAVRPDDAARERKQAVRDRSAEKREGEAAGDRAAAEPDREDKAARLSLVRPAPGTDTGMKPAGPAAADEPQEERVRMSRLRRSIAHRLVEAQQTAAILTTFNEVDMSRVMDWRARFKDKFAQTHGVALGFMSFFARACILALTDVPVVNARIEGDEIVTSKRVHLGIAASTERGLVVPVVRNADLLGMADLEREIGRLAELARTGRIGLDDLTGGTFTISNGGVFGSLMSTPILNPPQSAILGMHKIEKRPVVVGDAIVVRPMMYLALSYDHRLIDGREAVTYLVRVKERIEDPERLLLEV